MKEHLDVLGPAFARDTHYIRILIFSAAFQGTLLGFVASAFSLSVQKLAEATWYSGEYLQALSLVRVSTLLFGQWRMKSTKPPIIALFSKKMMYRLIVYYWETESGGIFGCSPLPVLV
mmetsp:Transcript_25445/g.51060  ORF Transcript_25445/g.51060 Transcript_25445/m.51060 type:complete len:118 (-) Transcript_25445:1602-1955(-)